MINTIAAHPWPGSITQVDGVRYKVLQHKPDRTALIAREGARASFVRTVALSDMIDPDLVDASAGLWLAGEPVETRRIALWIARHLRDANQCLFQHLIADVRRAAEAGDIPAGIDHADLARILTALGWQRKPCGANTPSLVSIWSRAKAS
ncbi:MAG: hypothetical protein U5M50_04100 [Sphingobium sp.]|nr:hypothetical protein [Sphingobium sp.]